MPRKERSMLFTIAALAWPTMVEQLMQTTVQYMDTAMVGTLGTQATAAVGATTTVNWLVGSTISALGTGFLAFISRSLGAGQRKEAVQATSQAFLTVGIVGVLFTLLTTALSSRVPVWMQTDPAIRELAGQYFLILYAPMLFRTANILFGTVLRSAGDTKTPMRVGIGMNLINVVLNFFLIYPTRTLNILDLEVWMPGAGWGVLGAAAASAIAFVFGGITITLKLWNHPLLSPRGQSFRPNGAILKPVMRVALPSLLQRFGTSLGYVVFASMINALGDISTAAHTIANTVESLFYIPGYGMQTAAATLAGNAYGARNREDMKKLVRFSMPLEIGLMMVSGGLLFLLARPLVGLFSTDERVIDLGSTVLKMVAFSEPFYGVSIIAEGLLMGVGNTLTPFLCGITGMWLVRICGTWVTTTQWGLGLEAAWGCMISHNLLLFVIYTLILIIGKWNPLERKTKS